MYKTLRIFFNLHGEIKQIEIIIELLPEKRSYKSGYGDEITRGSVTRKGRKVSTHDIVAVRACLYHFRCHILDGPAK